MAFNLSLKKNYKKMDNAPVCHMQLTHRSITGDSIMRNKYCMNNNQLWVIGDERDNVFGPRRLAYKTAFEFGDMCDAFKKSALFGATEPLIRHDDMAKDPDFQFQYFLLV